MLKLQVKVRSGEDLTRVTLKLTADKIPCICEMKLEALSYRVDFRHDYSQNRVINQEIIESRTPNANSIKSIGVIPPTLMSVEFTHKSAMRSVQIKIYLRVTLMLIVNVSMLFHCQEN